MKNLQSKVEGTWIDVQNVELTTEEQSILFSNEKENEVARKALIEAIEVKRNVAASEADSKFAQDIYEANKPKLEEGDTYELIIAIVIPMNKKGTISYKVNGKYSQVHF
jgi:hypothetical protein